MREDYYRERVRVHARAYPSFHPPSVELLFNVVYSYDVVAARLAQPLAEHGLSLSAFNVLMILSKTADKGCAMHELGELLLVSRANITGLIVSLEDRGLVSRAVHFRDRRVKITRITTAGRKLLEAILPDHYARIRRMCSGLTDEEMVKVSTLLTKLRSGLRNGPTAGGSQKRDRKHKWKERRELSLG